MLSIGQFYRGVNPLLSLASIRQLSLISFTALNTRRYLADETIINRVMFCFGVISRSAILVILVVNWCKRGLLVQTASGLAC